MTSVPCGASDKSIIVPWCCSIAILAMVNPSPKRLNPLDFWKFPLIERFVQHRLNFHGDVLSIVLNQQQNFRFS